jgi:hypothetical protein
MLTRLMVLLTLLIGAGAAQAATAGASGVTRTAHPARHRGCSRVRPRLVAHAARTPRQSRQCATLAQKPASKRPKRGKKTGKPPVLRVPPVRPVRPVLAPVPAVVPPVPPTPPVAPQSHVETWAVDDCGQGSGSVSSLVRSWVSYAETNCGPGGLAKALGDCHSGGSVFCNVIQYLDTNWIYPQGSPPYSQFSQAASESWYQHVPGSGSRVQTGAFGGGSLINQSSSAVQSFFQGYVRSHYDSADGLMMDDQGPGLGSQLYSSNCGCKTTAEITSDQALRAAHTSMSAAMTHSSGQPFVQIDNTLPPNPYLPQGLDMLNQGGVHGLLKEGSPENNGHLDPYYSTLLDQIAYVATQTNSFVVPLSYGQAGAASQQQSRRVQEATILLGYSPGHLVDWANLNGGSDDLSVWPEEGIYPTQPVQSMGTPGGSGCLAGTGNVCSTGGHNDLQVAPGVYRREFAACYDRGTAIGPCATIVNTTASPVTVASSWLTNSYAHQVTFNGGDVQSGGTINPNGATFTPNTTTTGPQDGLLLTQ